MRMDKETDLVTVTSLSGRRLPPDYSVERAIEDEDAPSLSSGLYAHVSHHRLVVKCQKLQTRSIMRSSSRLRCEVDEQRCNRFFDGLNEMAGVRHSRT